MDTNVSPTSKTVDFAVLPKHEQEAWRTYWTASGEKPEKQIDMTMVTKALRHPSWPRMWMTPTGDEDLRHLRPYFVVPLLEQAAAGEHELLRDEIVEECERKANSLKEGKVSDVFVLSHGWHRSFFSGVAAYDRLFGKFFGLVGRARIKRPRGFSPLYICCHWHSDPGVDGWVDPGGRREKTDFILRALTVFEPKPGGEMAPLINALEEAFVFMSRISAPDVSPSSPCADNEAIACTSRLIQLATLKNCGPMAPAPDIVSALWGCYNETNKLQVLVDQMDEPLPVASPTRSLMTLIGFVCTLLPLPALLPSLRKPLLDGLGLSEVTFVQFVRERSSDRVADLVKALIPVALFVLVYFGALAVLFVKRWLARRDKDTRTRSSKGWQYLLIASWLTVQAVNTFPLLSVLLSTWIFRSSLALFLVPLAYTWVSWLAHSQAWGAAAAFAVAVLAWLLATVRFSSDRPLPGLFSERLRKAGDEPWNVRDVLAGIARKPIEMVRASAGRDSSLYDLTKLVDNQLAFYALQRKSVDSGDDLGRFLALLYYRCPDLKTARLHFVGHSFGGLVILNAARRLFCDFQGGVGIPAPKPNPKLRSERRKLDSGLDKTVDVTEVGPKTNVILLQGALASDWFRGEGEWARHLRTAAAIFSKYDTATGFYYPFSNNGRLASGYVGLCKTPSPAHHFGAGGSFAMLLEPPDSVTKSAATFLNIDASRNIFQGRTAVGGGHDDIFKDDVINLIWSIVRR